jgi:rubredoxin
MNLVVTCEGCGSIYRVMQQHDGADVDLIVGEHSEFWPNKYTCPRCGARAAGAHEDALPRGFQTVSIIDLTAEELLAALYALGLPEERKTALADVQGRLTKNWIAHVVGHDVAQTGRCCIDYLEMADGTKIYLGASTHGAVVYRVVSPASYVKRVEEETANACDL